jgi:hypothetical protein
MSDLYPLQAVGKTQEIAFSVLEIKIAGGKFIASSLQMHIDAVEIPELQGAPFWLQGKVFIRDSCLERNAVAKVT